MKILDYAVMIKEELAARREAFPATFRGRMALPTPF